MKNLPFVTLWKIFGELDSLNEVVRCSLVCKNWRAAYEAYKPKTLCLCHDNYMPLHHRLILSNERLTRLNFFKTSKDFQFLQSDITRAHFANIRKLIVFQVTVDPFANYYVHCGLSFRDQINHFRSLEYLEIQNRILSFEDNELELPELKTLRFLRSRFESENISVVLNTPLLENLCILQDEFDSNPKIPKLTDFKFLFPHQLKYLVIRIHQENFKFETKFENLECLVLLSDPCFERDFSGPKLSDNFLAPLTSLKFLFHHRIASAELFKLEEQKRKLGLNKLIFQEFDFWPQLDYENWHKYEEQRDQYRYSPAIIWTNFHDLVNCQMYPRYLEENSLSLSDLEVGTVSDQPLLIEFLKHTRIGYIAFHEDFNLGQDFFNQIAGFLSVGALSFFEKTLNRLTDFTFITKCNFFCFYLTYEQFPREMVSAVLRNPSCYTFVIHRYSGWWEYDGERRLDENNDFYHRLWKRVDSFTCDDCGWISENDPSFSEALIQTAVRHLELPRFNYRRFYEENKSLKNRLLQKLNSLFGR